MTSLLDSTISLFLSKSTTLLICSLFFFAFAYGQSENVASLEFVAKHRVNAHGDEFNALAKSSDGRRSYIGTEKGNVIIWNLTSGNVERALHQPSAIHHLAALSDPSYVIAAGSNHHPPLKPLVRKWNVQNGTFEDLSGLASDSFPTALTCSDDSGLLAVGLADGTTIVWDTTSNKVVATLKVNEVPIALAIVARQVYVAGISRESIRMDREPNENAIMQFNVDDPARASSEFLKMPGRYWSTLGSSLDHRLLIATYRSPGGGEHTVLIEPQSKSELSTLEGSEFAWINPNSFVRFEGFDPTEIVELDPRKKTSSVRKLGRMQNDTEGRAFELTGQIANADGTKVWATYRKGPGFLEFDLDTQKIKTLIDGPSGAYAISVITKDSNEGVLATGGADGYVRVWNLSDLALTKEYHVVPPDSFITDVHLLHDGRRAVVGVMHIPKTREDRYKEPVQILLLDLTSGRQKNLFEMPSWQGHVSVVDDLIMYPSFDRMKLTSLESSEPLREFIVKESIRKTTLSSNNKWLAVLDEDKVLTVFAAGTAKQLSSKIVAADDYGPLAITNDGHYVYQVSHEGKLITWDTQSGKMSTRVLRRLQEMHTNVDFITLANDDKWLVTAGNHGDIGIFERASGDLVCYAQSDAAVFYAEQVWLSGDRLIFTTDTGVMFDGRLVKSSRQ